MTEIDDAIWDEEVQNYRVEQVIAPLRDALAPASIEYLNPNFDRKCKPKVASRSVLKTLILIPQSKTQAKKASRSVSQQAEAKARAAELSEARVMQQAKLDTGDLEEQADEARDKSGMWVP